jgi:hypothetical protein
MKSLTIHVIQSMYKQFKWKFIPLLLIAIVSDCLYIGAKSILK